MYIEFLLSDLEQAILICPHHLLVKEGIGPNMQVPSSSEIVYLYE